MTTSADGLSLEIDQEAEAAYLRFSRHKVARTEEVTDSIAVDLDEHGMAVGIEILDLNESVNLDELAPKYHIRSETLVTLVFALRSSMTSASASTAGSASAQRAIGPGAAISSSSTVAC